MEPKILILSLALVATCEAADPSAASALNAALENFKAVGYEEALKAASAIKTDAAKFPGNPHFSGLHGQIAAVFTAERKLEAAKNASGQGGQGQLKTIGQARMARAEASRQLVLCKQELSRALEGANAFNQQFYQDGYEEPAKSFQAVLTRVALRNEVTWTHLSLERKQVPAEPVAGGGSDVIPELTVTVEGGGTRTFKNVTLDKVETDGVALRHSGGFAKVAFDKLPEAYRAKWEAARPSSSGQPSEAPPPSKPKVASSDAQAPANFPRPATFAEFAEQFKKRMETVVQDNPGLEEAISKALPENAPKDVEFILRTLPLINYKPFIVSPFLTKLGVSVEVKPGRSTEDFECYRQIVDAQQNKDWAKMIALGVARAADADKGYKTQIAEAVKVGGLDGNKALMALSLHNSTSPRKRLQDAFMNFGLRIMLRVPKDSISSPHRIGFICVADEKALADDLAQDLERAIFPGSFPGRELIQEIGDTGESGGCDVVELGDCVGYLHEWNPLNGRGFFYREEDKDRYGSSEEWIFGFKDDDKDQALDLEKLIEIRELTPGNARERYIKRCDKGMKVFMKRFLQN